MKKKYKAGSAIKGNGKVACIALMLPLYFILLIIVAYINWELLRYPLLVLFVLNLLFVFISRNHLIVNYENLTFKSSITFFWIRFGRWYSFEKFRFIVLKSYNNTARFTSWTLPNNSIYTGQQEFSMSSSGWIIEVWNPDTKDTYQIYNGGKNKSTEVIQELCVKFPHLKSFKNHIKNGNEFDFTKLKRKSI